MYACMCRTRARLLKAKVDDLKADLTQHQAAAYHPTHVCTTRLRAGMRMHAPHARTARTHRSLDPTEIVLVCPVGLVCRDAPFPHIARVLAYDLHTSVRILAHVLSRRRSRGVRSRHLGIACVRQRRVRCAAVARPGQTAPSLPPCPHPRSAGVISQPTLSEGVHARQVRAEESCGLLRCQVDVWKRSRTVTCTTMFPCSAP